MVQLARERGLRNPFLRKKVSEAHLPSGIHSALGTVSCGGDGRGEHGLLTPRTEAVFRNLGLQSPFSSWLPDNSDPELEEVSVENGSVSPPPFKQSPRIRRKGWQARQRPGTRAEGESESQDVGDAYKAPSMGPNPGMDGDWVYENLAFYKEQESLLSRYQRGEKQGLLLLHSKTPSWNKENGVYTLNFHGRVTRASVKNFQIVDPKHPEHLVLQFGRVGPDTFTMDFCFPFSPLQAFGVCLSSFSWKLAVE
ncbi:tubby-related protein 2 isoform X3 [Macaca fascicularis]|uniref:tubby-related protein 2 isoform X3 n=1 Tax=Macaca fascicularis TaxID=9541 RepID=UPI003D15CC6C